MPDLRPEAVGPYLALVAYTRAAGARNHAHAKAIVDDVITTYPEFAMPDLLEVIDARLAPMGIEVFRRT